MFVYPTIPTEYILTAFLFVVGIAIVFKVQFARQVRETVAQKRQKMETSHLKIGPKRKKMISWPIEALDRPSRLWQLCAFVLGVDLVASVLNQYTNTSAIAIVMSVVAILLGAGAAVDSFNLNELSDNPEFKPPVEAPHVMRGFMVGGFVIVDIAEAVLAVLLIEIRSVIPEWLTGLAVVFVLSIVASILLIARVVRMSEKSKWLTGVRERIAFWVFCSPLAYLVVVELVTKFV